MTDVVNNIYEVFKDYYGEDKVDIQTGLNGHWIYVYWPEVRVTNENGRFVDIWGLYAKVLVYNNGQLASHKPYFIRDTYNTLQWNCNYKHSHLPRSYSNNDFLTWSNSPCLGSGPINYTIKKLRGEAREMPTAFQDMDIWGIFCWELDKYVHIESLAGGPYYRLEAISNNSHYKHQLPEYKASIYSNRICRDKDFIKEFCRYLLNKKVLKIAYNNGSYCLGDSYFNIALTISDTFIDWYNTEEKYNIISKEDLYENNYIQKVIVKDGNLYDISDRGSLSTLDSIVGRPLGFHFKNQTVTLHKKEEENEETPTASLILHNDIMGYIIYRILTYLNSEYGKSNNNNSSEEAPITEEIIKVI